MDKSEKDGHIEHFIEPHTKPHSKHYTERSIERSIEHHIEHHKGRGAVSNPANRFAHLKTEPFDDGWDSTNWDSTNWDSTNWDSTNWDIAENPTSSPKTIVLKDNTKSIISSNKSPDIPFDKSINPYRGCEHGCIYCYARPTHAYWDLSPGLDFETKIFAKPDAARLLREKLSKPGYQPKPLCIGANTDPYQPIESDLEITRSILEVLAEFRHPFSIITKSALIRRDLDILGPMAEQNLCSVAVSTTTLDNNLKRILEPRTPSGQTRLKTIASLSDANIPVTLLAAPMIPYINDAELEDILTAGRQAGARSARYILLRLPLEVSEMFQDWLHTHFPDRADKVMNIIRQSRGGSDYQSAFGIRMRGTGHFADLLEQRWRICSKKLGFENEDRFDLDYTLFRRTNEQLPLF
jgi:DNA repair photolyase